jgi:hypothetical protein
MPEHNQVQRARPTGRPGRHPLPGRRALRHGREITGSIWIATPGDYLIAATEPQPHAPQRARQVRLDDSPHRRGGPDRPGRVEHPPGTRVARRDGKDGAQWHLGVEDRMRRSMRDRNGCRRERWSRDGLDGRWPERGRAMLGPQRWEDRGCCSCSTADGRAAARPRTAHAGGAGDDRCQPGGYQAPAPTGRVAATTTATDIRRP